MAGKRPHVLAVPFPAQGHVKPLMSLCRQIAKHGIKVTFVNAESIHQKILSASPQQLQDGSLQNGVVVSLSNDIPSWRNGELPWSFPINPEIEKVIFEAMKKGLEEASKAKWLLCKSCHELEPAATELVPNVLPVGPLNLLDSNNVESTNFFCEDSSCLRWLDTQPDESVVYVSFGSLAVFSLPQLAELALGLELSGRAFLCVIRPNLANGSRVVYPPGFGTGLGKIVEWAPQNKVLSHPSIGCFVSHCGWNSTIEGVSNGVPFLCWSYTADQLHNERYICEKWGIGLKIDFDEEWIRSRYEIKNKIDMLLCDNKFKENALKLKEMCGKSVGDGGTSCNNLKKFIDHINRR